jgi:hypothetical protein
VAAYDFVVQHRHRLSSGLNNTAENAHGVAGIAKRPDREGWRQLIPCRPSRKIAPRSLT